MSSPQQEFKIKGAASRRGSQASSVAQHSDRSNSEQDAAASKTPVVETAEGDKTSRKRKADAIEPSDEDLKAQYHWIKVAADPDHYGTSKSYYTNKLTGLSIWEEPNEPYWVWSFRLNNYEPTGLKEPGNPASGYTGYDPKIHGNYDPKAPYAQYHVNLRLEEQAVVDYYQSFKNLGASAASGYQSTVNLNRFTGNVQRPEFGTERHTDAAKSRRQQDAYYDVNAADNAHDGRSLKEERRNKKLSKAELARFKQTNKEKKIKKQKAFYMS